MRDESLNKGAAHRALNAQLNQARPLGFKVLLANDLTQWADRFLAALEGLPVIEMGDFNDQARREELVESRI